MTQKKKVRRSALVMVRLKPEERRRMEVAAKVKGLGISAWLRMVALESLDEKTKKVR